MTFPAGSGVDVVARTIQEPLGKVLGQPVIIDYKVGAAGNVASEYVARAKPDGYTVVFGTAATHGSNAALYKKLPSTSRPTSCRSRPSSTCPTCSRSTRK
jgi:tripartite-type tricarboxylate transporter receptor subunit TctC